MIHSLLIGPPTYIYVIGTRHLYVYWYRNGCSRSIFARVAGETGEFENRFNSALESHFSTYQL
jgi:hypothetical protein